MQVMMKIYQRLTMLWIVLAFATLASFFTTNQSLVSPVLAVVVIMLIAYSKARLVLLYFMEMAHAPRAWRVIFEVWLAAVTLEILAFYMVHII
jgi:heme/copper-type cytochrome/quinol oxidase subunit 4